MFKTATVALLAAAAQAFVHLKEAEPVSANPPCSFMQVDADGDFLMDISTTSASPNPPVLGKTVNFTIGGIWMMDEQIDHLNFQCKLYGALAYNQDFADVEAVTVGEAWTHTIPFDVPPVAPPGEYDVTVFGIDKNGAELFAIFTKFYF